MLFANSIFYLLFIQTVWPWQDWTFFHWLSERRMPLGTIGPSLVKYRITMMFERFHRGSNQGAFLSAVSLWCSRGFWDALNWAPILRKMEKNEGPTQRETSLSTPDRCRFSSRESAALGIMGPKWGAPWFPPPTSRQYGTEGFEGGL